MIGTSPRPREVPRSPQPAPVINLSPQSHRWWQLHSGRDGHFVLGGLASDAVWLGSVAHVPCWFPTGPNAGPCACGLHAPASAVDRARSLGSFVVGGGVRLLSVDHGDPQRPTAIVTVEGPLHLVAWCAGDADGFTLERCGREVRWILPGSPTTATCRKHLRRRSPRVRRQRVPVAEFMRKAAAALHHRYGVEVAIGAVSAQPSPPDLAPATPLNPKTVTIPL